MPDEDAAHGPESPEKGGTRPAQESAGAERSQDVPPPAEPGVPGGLAGSAASTADSSGPESLPDAAEAYHRRARLAEDRLEEVLAAYRKLKSENERYRDRLTRNIERRYDQRRERLLLKFMEILDNLDRALEAAEQSQAGDDLIQGLILVRTQLLQTLQLEGLERIPVLGLPYDPAVSEAVGMQAVQDMDLHQVVIKEMLRGYRLNGRLARASRVIVGEWPGASTTAPERPAPDKPRTAEEPSLEEIIARAEAEDTPDEGGEG